MGRIRTIKPEFPQSESMGRISRDARLCFIQLWTLADDSGRLRGSSRMLASLLYPYDDDAKDLIDGWLDELDRNDCIRRYKVDGDSYIEICKWLIHQKIDRPTPSKIPPFDESSRVLASPRESSALDQGRDQGRDLRTKEGEAPQAGAAPAKPSPPSDPPIAKPGKPPRRVSAGRLKSLADYLAECREAGVKPIPEDHYIRRYCVDVGIEPDMLVLAWLRFREEHTVGRRKAKRYIDWQDAFANSVKDRWYRLWTVNSDGPAGWTSEGVQARRAEEAKAMNQEEQHEPA